MSLFYIILVIFSIFIFWITPDKYIIIYSIYFFGLALLYLIIERIKYVNKCKKIYDSIECNDYVRNTDFSQISAVESGIIIKKTKISIETIITAIFEMEYKGYINIKYKDNLNYVSIRNINLDKLFQYEKSILCMIFDGPDDKKKYVLEDVINSLYQDKTLKVILKFIKDDINQYLRKKYKSNDYNDDSLYNCFYSSIILLIFSCYTRCIIHLSNIDFTILVLIIIGVIGVIFILLFNRLSKRIDKDFLIEYISIRKTYDGLYKYLKDFTVLNEMDIGYYQLYDKYYLLAMGMGIADEFTNRFKRKNASNNSINKDLYNIKNMNKNKNIDNDDSFYKFMLLASGFILLYMLLNIVFVKLAFDDSLFEFKPIIYIVVISFIVLVFSLVKIILIKRKNKINNKALDIYVERISRWK